MGGISKNKVKQAFRRIFRVRTWKLALILLPLIFVAATLLRLNHLKMIDLRNQVLEMDKNGSDQEILLALNQLRSFTLSHVVVNVIEQNGIEKITFGTGPFYLEHQYIKKAKAELAKSEASLETIAHNPNGNVFKKAAAVCDELGKKFGWNYNKPYFDCIFSELEKYPAMNEIKEYHKAMIPPTSLYRHDYASPLWRPSLVSFIILLCLLLILVIFIRFIIWITLKITLIIVKKR